MNHILTCSSVPAAIKTERTSYRQARSRCFKRSGRLHTEKAWHDPALPSFRKLTPTTWQNNLSSVIFLYVAAPAEPESKRSLRPPCAASACPTGRGARDVRERGAYRAAPSTSDNLKTCASVLRPCRSRQRRAAISRKTGLRRSFAPTSNAPHCAATHAAPRDLAMRRQHRCYALPGGAGRCTPSPNSLAWRRIRSLTGARGRCLRKGGIGPHCS